MADIKTWGLIVEVDGPTRRAKLEGPFGKMDLERLDDEQMRRLARMCAAQEPVDMTFHYPDDAKPPEPSR